MWRTANTARERCIPWSKQRLVVDNVDDDGPKLRDTALQVVLISAHVEGLTLDDLQIQSRVTAMALVHRMHYEYWSPSLDNLWPMNALTVYMSRKDILNDLGLLRIIPSRPPGAPPMAASVKCTVSGMRHKFTMARRLSTTIIHKDSVFNESRRTIT